MPRQPLPIFDADHGQLSSLFNMEPVAERLWRDDELRAMLQHQLTAPLRVDLINMDKDAAVGVRTLADAQGLTLKSFGDLLAHPHPPIELLKITKDFAKACRLSPHSSLPREIASVLYFASIAAALVRCQRRITGLTNDALKEGLHWVLARPWLDAPTRALIEACLPLLPRHEREPA